MTKISSILYCLSLSILLSSSVSTNAQTDKYRLAYRDDPATTVVIGWSGNYAEVCYDTIDHGKNWELYSFRHGADRSVEYKEMSNHFARLTGLKPKATYYFVVKSNIVSNRFYFKTLTDEWNTHDTISFVIGGDTRTGLPYEEDYQSCRYYRRDGNRLVAALRPDFVSFGGDYVYELPGIYTDPDAWKLWLDDWQLTKTYDGQMFPMVHALGNHEIAEDVYNLFDVPNQDLYYALNFGGNLFRLYSLNSEENACDYMPQKNWLENDLNNHSFNEFQPYWKIAQYHNPMITHSAIDASKQDIIDCWAPKFRYNKVNLVFENHSHLIKYTWPIVPYAGVGNDNGFIRDDNNGTVYVGDGSWGAPLIAPIPSYAWTRNTEKLHAFHFVTVSTKEITVRTINFLNANIVEPLPPRTSSAQMPKNINIWTPSNGSTVVLNKPNIVAVDEHKPSSNLIEIFPNPASDYCTINLSKLKENNTIELYNSFGKLISVTNLSKDNQSYKLDLKNLSKGAYFIIIKSGSYLESHKLFIQ